MSEPESSNPLDNRCLVIGPIGDRLAEVGTPGRTTYEESLQTWETVILPACQAAGLSPDRADKLTAAGEIPEQVLRRLRDDDVVIADVTGGNPNVMYELGLRHTQDKLTIQIGEAQRLPFDVAAVRTILFRRSEGGLVEARDQLIEFLRSGLAGQFDPVTATRVWNQPRQSGATDVPDVGPADEEEEGFLELLVKSEEELPNLSVIAAEMAQVIGELTDVSNASVAEIQQSDKAGGGSAGRLRVALRFADSLESLSQRMDSLATDYEGTLKRVDPGIGYLISQVEEDSSIMDDAPQFRQGLGELAQSVRQMVSALDSSAQQLPQLGEIARPLRVPANRLAGALRRIISASVVIDNWDSRLRRAIAADENGV